MRVDGRGPDELRVMSFEPGYLKFADGSCLVRAGDTVVLAAATYDASVPLWLEGKAQGWITAEYSMLPASTPSRNRRESLLGRPSARSQEISRLVGRSLRMAFDLKALGEATLTVDCDVIQADGGTRTLSVCAGFCALYQALERLQAKGFIPRIPLRGFVAATSVGIVDGRMIVDLCYEEDSRAEVDANLVCTENGKIVELQLTAEREPASFEQEKSLVSLGYSKIVELIESMKNALHS